MENVTHDNLPGAVSKLLADVALLTSLLTNQVIQPAPQTDQWFSLDELCNYLPGNPAKATIYGKVHNREIPHKKVGKRLAFLKSEIDMWLKSQGRKTTAELATDAGNFLKKGPKAKRSE